MNTPVKSKEVCRVLWFDRKGSFTKAPSSPTQHLRPKAVPGLKEKPIRVEGGGTAILTHRGKVTSVRYIPDKTLREQYAMAQRRGDRSFVRGYKEWVRSVQRELAKDALPKRKLELGRKLSRALEKSQASDRGRKGAAERGKGRAAQSKLKNLSNGQLLAYKPTTVYEQRAKRAELKARGLKK